MEKLNYSDQLTILVVIDVCNDVCRKTLTETITGNFSRTLPAKKVGVIIQETNLVFKKLAISIDDAAADVIIYYQIRGSIVPTYSAKLSEITLKPMPLQFGFGLGVLSHRERKQFFIPVISDFTKLLSDVAKKFQISSNIESSNDTVILSA